jgi:hypothetical protein
MTGRNTLLSASRAEDEIPEDEDQAAAEEQEEEAVADSETDDDDDENEDGPTGEDDEPASEEEEEEMKAMAGLRSRASADKPLRAAMQDGRRIERARINRILGSKAAEANPDLARYLALETPMPSKDAIATLDRVPRQPAGASDFRKRVQATQPAALPSGAKAPGESKPGERLVAAADRRAASNPR